MFLLFIVCLMKLIEMYSINNSNNNKMTHNKCLRNAKENNFGALQKSKNNNCYKTEVNENRFPMSYFYDIDQSCEDELKEYLQSKRSGFNSFRGMNINPTYQPATVKSKLIKTGLSSQQEPTLLSKKAPPSLLKQPLSSLNTNYTRNNHKNNYYDQQGYYQSKQLRDQYKRELNELSEDVLKNDVQIVLNNINNIQNALLNQKKIQKQRQQDCFNYLNIFGSNSPPVAKNHRTRKMSTSPVNCDSTNNNNNNNMGPTNMLGCSFASDFTHDNSDYQWFIDYGYRDGGIQHHSILSSLSASYNGIGELSYYDDLARNIDANLAEVDMENFRSEDIHSLLNIHQEENMNTKRLLLKDQSELDNSICKSEILFSPVKESHISVDSLDMDGYHPDDIILTCQANKNNYTIAFEGSCMYSDESYYDIPEIGKLKQNSINLDNILNNKKTTDVEMTQSDNGYTTWSQLKKSSDQIHMHRYPSGNNNNSSNNNTTNINFNSSNNNNNNTINTCTHYFDYKVRKSSSMPNLKAMLQKQQKQQQAQQNQNANHLNISEIASNNSQTSLDSDSKVKTMLHYPVPIASSEESDNHASNENYSNSNNERALNPPSFNLVKLFIKQKSSSSDTCMDVSSGCWPSDSTNSSTEHPGNCSNSSVNRLRKKSMNDSGKFSALSRHPEEDAEYQLDSLDAHANIHEKKTNDFNREIFDSPTHRRHYRDCALNIKNQMKNPLLFNVLNNNNHCSGSQSDTSRTSENLTQVLKHDIGTKITIPIESLTKSIQTSSILMPKAETNSKKLPQSCITMVPPSFLSQLSKLGDQQQAPVYVIYPNYALPDLEFINNQQINLRNDIIMSPLSYQGQQKMTRTLDLKQQKHIPFRKRPQSLDIDKLQQNQYSHVQDWNSLLTLLPRDYKKLLKNIPEVNKISSMEASISAQKPLFCMTPPIRRTTTGLICDCQALFQNQTVTSSSSGSSAQPPSSGYRGSSTMISDSEMEEIINGTSSGDAMKNMFVYQYDNIPELEQRPPTGRKGILRRINTTTNTPLRVSNTNVQKQKRYSMLDQPKSPQQAKNTPSCQTQQEKRRSLQETNFYHHNDLEDYFNNIGIGGTKNFANRLPNYMKARDDQRGSDNGKDLNQLLTELELNKALSNKLNYEHQNGTNVDIQEIEARLKAESFLNAIPKSELKNYTDIVNLLEWNQVMEKENPFERTKLRNEVSKTLSRKVSFNHPSPTPSPVRNAKTYLQAPDYEKKFTTPPNSPQMSLVDKKSPVDKKQQQQRLEKEKQDKIQSNRFKRLQIQWELLSKEQNDELIMETKSNATTPTGIKCQSKIPRPVSYPNPKQNHELLIGGKNLRSPSKMNPPKKYTTTPTTTNVTSPTGIIQTTPRTPNKQLHNTPKKTVTSRTATRTR